MERKYALEDQIERKPFIKTRVYKSKNGKYMVHETIERVAYPIKKVDEIIRVSSNDSVFESKSETEKDRN